MKARVAVVAAVLAVVASQAAAAEIAWGTDLSQALQQARADDKLVLVDFFTAWCGWCKRLEKDVYSKDAAIELIAKHFVPVKIDGDKRQDLVRRFAIRGYPTTLVLAPDGRVIKKIVGYRPLELFVAELKESLELADLREQIPQLKEKLAQGGQQATAAAAQLGYIYRRMGDRKTARKYLRQARDAGCTDPALQLDLLLNDASGAALINGLRKWCEANKEHPRVWEAYFELGMAQANMKLWKDAVASLDAAANGSPDRIWGIRAAFYARVIRERYLPAGRSDQCPAAST